MTIAEVLRKVDIMKPNRFTAEQKVGWLNEIERQIWFDIVSTHDNPMRISNREYDVNSDPDTVLIAPPPYDELYTLYLQCQIDLGNMEIGKYNNNRTLFNNALMTFRDYWNRTFIPCDRARCFVFDDRKRQGIHIPYDGRKLHSMGNPLNIDEKPIPHIPNRVPSDIKMGLPKMAMKSVPEEIAQIHATDIVQQKQIDDMKKSAGKAMTSEEVGDILV